MRFPFLVAICGLAHCVLSVDAAPPLDHLALEYYRLEVDRLKLLLQLDATHYRSQLEGYYAALQTRHDIIRDLTQKLESCQATVQMQKSLLQSWNISKEKN